jgi:hypothetical protein
VIEQANATASSVNASASSEEAAMQRAAAALRSKQAAESGAAAATKQHAAAMNSAAAAANNEAAAVNAAGEAQKKHTPYKTYNMKGLNIDPGDPQAIANLAASHAQMKDMTRWSKQDNLWNAMSFGGWGYNPNAIREQNLADRDYMSMLFRYFKEAGGSEEDWLLASSGQYITINMNSNTSNSDLVDIISGIERVGARA